MSKLISIVYRFLSPLFITRGNKYGYKMGCTLHSYTLKSYGFK